MDRYPTNKSLKTRRTRSYQQIIRLLTDTKASDAIQTKNHEQLLQEAN